MGVVLTCTAFAWPLPTIQWVSSGGGELPEGVVSESNAESATDTGSTVSARLRWTRGFQDSDQGQFICVVSWDNYDDRDQSDSQTVTIVSTSEPVASPTTKPVCRVDSSVVAFQLRVLTNNCNEWDPHLHGHIQEEFSEELHRILISSCNCTILSSSVRIDSLACSQSREGAVVFEGTIETDTKSMTEQVYCTLQSWQESGPVVLVANSLYSVDTTCHLQLDEDSNEECVAAGSSESGDLDIMILIYIAAPVGLAVLVLLVLVSCVCCWSMNMRSKRDLSNRETW